MADRLNANERLLPTQSITSPNGRFILVMQADSNLVLYYIGSRAIWSSDTWRLGNAGVYAIMQGDGNLVLYLPSGIPVWATGTNAPSNSRSVLVLQDDGNLVMYRSDGSAAWASNTVIQANAPVETSREEEVGNDKRMRTNAILYRDGRLGVSAYTESQHPTEGLRGRLFIVAVDDRGRSHYVSEEFVCTTRGSTFDFFTPSRGTDAFFQNFPEPVGRLSQRLDIYHGTGPLGDPLAGVKNFLKGAQDVYDEIKPFLEQLQ
jgi:hypothetical protein